MKRMRYVRLGSVLLLLFAFLLLAGCDKKDKTADPAAAGSSEAAKQDISLNENILQEIRDRGYLVAGCKADTPRMGFYDEKTDTWSGLEVDLAWKTAAALFEVSEQEAREKELLHIVPVTVADREEKLEAGEVDCLFSTYTITPERAERFDLSESYFTDFISFLVRNEGEDSNTLGGKNIKSIADLNGKNIGVASKSTTRAAILRFFSPMNSQTIDCKFFEYPSYDSLYKALKAKQIDAVAVDVTILEGYVDSTTRILGDRFGAQRYGAAVKKENHALIELINQTLAKQ